jgi:hypothetical protein
MTHLGDLPEPTKAELWAIEAEAEVLMAELTLVDAETALFAQPSKTAASAYLQALLDLVDLQDFTDHQPSKPNPRADELLYPARDLGQAS